MRCKLLQGKREDSAGALQSLERRIDVWLDEHPECQVVVTSPLSLRHDATNGEVLEAELFLFYRRMDT